MSTESRQFMSADEYGRTLAGLSLNLIFRVLHQTADYAALERDGATIQLHADRTYTRQPWGRASARACRRSHRARAREGLAAARLA